MISEVSMMNSPMDVTVSEGMPSDSEIEDTGMTSASLDFKSFNRRQADIELNAFAEGLTAAARAVFTCRSQPQYRKVCVLMLEREDAEILQESGISELFDVFRNTFHFDVERWKIRSKASELAAFQKLDAFVESEGNKLECLKIIYYSEINRQRDEKFQAFKSLSLVWNEIHSALTRSNGDFLVFSDCGYPSITESVQGNGVIEVIAAPSPTSHTKPYLQTFTKDLEVELRELSKVSSFSIGNLYHTLFCRTQLRNLAEGLELPAPIHQSITQNDPLLPRSIRLRVRKESDNGTAISNHQLEGNFEVREPFEQSSDMFDILSTSEFLCSSVVGLEDIPRVAFAIRLMDNLKTSDPSFKLFEERLRLLPASEVRIETGFHSLSSLLIVSVPICMSLYIPKNPAIISLGAIKSFNQVLSPAPALVMGELPPTPTPDSYIWDTVQTMNGTERRATKRTNATTSEVRFRKDPQIIGDKPMRPILDKGYSSRLSFNDTLSEDGPHRNGLHHSHTVDVPSPFENSHQIHPFGLHETETNGPQSKAHAKIKTYSDDNTKEYPRISRPVELLRNSYDCVVIGSGYGGGVAASRMARAGQSVCLLERGKERWPGEYPSGFIDAFKQLHVSGEFAPGFLKGAMVEGGDPTGLYHLICGKGQNAFVGNGLGGTSLLNANVFLETDAQTMKMPCWPRELQEDDALKEYYERAKDVLQPEEYPQDWPALPKLTMLERQAKALGWGEKFRRVPQTTRFKGGPNSTGVEMYPSALTGMDSTGVNDGSKNSTLVNYLSDAWNWGAEMFCECEVRYIKKHPDPDEEGYLVFFAWHGSDRGAFQSNLYEDLMWVHAKKCVFLGAGSIGSTEILLRSKKLGLSMSDKVGVGMSGNGDILAFGYNTDTEVNAIGRQYPSPYKPIGPTIAGIIDCREGHENPLDGFVIEEGAIPKALAPLFQTMLEMMPGNQLPKGETLASRVKHALAQQGSRFLGPYFSKGSIERTQIYLIMSHDSNQALLTLKDDKPVLEFLGVGRSEHVEYLNDVLRQATQAVGGTFVNSPFYAALGQQEITVHPIGGACMSNSGTGEHGVTNHFGEVFSGRGRETHPGLIVTDGAVIPTALGVNPFATITALAERSVEHAAKYRILQPIDLETKNNILDLFAEPHQYNSEKKSLRRKDTKRISEATQLIKATRKAKTNGFGFSEVMSGYIHVGEGVEGDKQEDYETAAKTARGLCEEARFFLSVKAWDTETIVNRADHKAMLTGTFTCAGLPGSPFMVQRGNFHLFSTDQQAPGTRNLTYDFDMTSTDGQNFHFHGFKVVDSSVALGPWRFWTAASTLYVTISQADGDQEVLGRGMMHIRPVDFISEIFTLSPSGRNILSKLSSTLSFMGFFARQSASLFLAPFAWQEYPTVTYTGYINDTSPDETIKVSASDGVQTLLHVWESRNMDIEPMNILMIPGASVDQQIFALPTIEVNAVNYLTRAGYRVFVCVHRICQVAAAERSFTTYDSRLDIRACYEWINEHYSPDPVYTIAHCMGSVAYSCGLLDGTIKKEWVRGISCSQVFMNPIWSPLNMAKVEVGPVPFDKLYRMTGGHWFSCSSSRNDSYFQQLVNQVLRFYPDDRKEMCNNVSCHRCSLVFGRLWNHRNLNEATHRQINRFFGGVNMTLLHTLMQQGRRGVVTTNGPLFTSLPTRTNIKRLRGIPILLFSGADNQVLTPESTERTFDILRRELGDGEGRGGYGGGDMYRRVVVGEYGHLDCWMGRKAYVDVFPMIREEVDRVCRGEDYVYQERNWKVEWSGWKDLPQNKGKGKGKRYARHANGV